MPSYYNITIMLNRRSETRRLHTNSHGQAVREVLDAISKQVTMYAWVVMPDHIHLLFSREKPLKDVDSFAGRVKRWINKTLAMRGMAKMRWLDGCTSYPVGPENLAEARDHILKNPVRGGLVQQPEDYSLAGQPAPLPGR
jgi:REP element-mobilizing transposase RayT